MTRCSIFRIGTNLELIGLVLYNTEATDEDPLAKNVMNARYNCNVCFTILCRFLQEEKYNIQTDTVVNTTKTVHTYYAENKT
jgi:hypothetical protein